MKKLLSGLLILLLLVLLLSFTAAEGNRKIIIEEAGYSVYLGKPQTISAAVENIGEDAPAKTTLVWKSSDESIAKVDGRGKVTGVSAGKVQITVTAQDDESIQASVEVEIRIPVKTVAIDSKSVTLYIGGTEDQAKTALAYSVEPDDASDRDVIWSSSNDQVVTVDQNGAVTALMKGNAVITAVSTDPTGTKKSTCKVSVMQAVTGLEIEQDEYTVPAPNTCTVKTAISPADAYNKTLIWSSSDENVAVVSDRGVVKGISEGEATITVASADGGGVTATCKVKVVVPVKKITVNDGNEIILPAGENKRVKALAEPEDATIKDIVWSSSNEEVATVDQTGMVSAVGRGNARITATSTDGSGVKGEVKVSVQSFDYVFRSRTSESLELYTTFFGGNNIKVKTQNQTVDVTVSGVSTIIGGGGVQNGTSFTIMPIKAGTDVITFKYGSSTIRRTVYVTPEAVGESPENPDESGEESGTMLSTSNDTGNPDEILFLGIPWGSSYPEAKSILTDQKKELKSLIRTNNNLRAVVDNDIVFADCSAFKAAMNFSYNQDDTDYEENNVFYEGDFYFDNKFTFDEVVQAITSVYNLEPGANTGGTYTWKKNDVQLILTQKQKFMILEITKEHMAGSQDS